VEKPVKLPKFSTPPFARKLALKAKLQRLALDDKPIILGPWRSELGFEALYWLPFLHYCADQIPHFWDRAVVLSRGGAACWYPAKRSIDLFSLRTLQDFREANNRDQLEIGIQKQMKVMPWDREVVKEAAARLGMGAHHVLHPSWMYWTTAPFMTDKVGVQWIAPLLKFNPIPVPAVPPDVQLPQKFAAVKFYHRPTLPDNPMTREFIKNMVNRLAAQLPVVLLHQPNLHADDHHDIPVKHPNVMHLPDFPVEQNLEYQTAVLARSHVFVGTYGGVGQLALRLGRPSLTFYTAFMGMGRAHLTLSQTVATQVSGTTYQALSISDVGLAKLALRETRIERVVETVAS
jgi:hypothetical protein